MPEDDTPQSNEAIKLDQLTPGEDLGNTIQRPQPPREEITITSLVPGEKSTSHAAGAPPIVYMEDLIVLDLDAPIIRIIPAATSAARKEDTLTTSIPTTAKPKKKKKAKARVKRDVIDDIFG